MKLNVVRSTA